MPGDQRGDVRTVQRPFDGQCRGDRDARGTPVRLPDGTEARRLPGYFRWITDGAFCGSISLRWQPGTTDLPPHVLGHVGFAVVPWKRDRGYATRALALLLPDARSLGLGHVDLTTDPANTTSQLRKTRATLRVLAHPAQELRKSRIRWEILPKG